MANKFLLTNNNVCVVYFRSDCSIQRKNTWRRLYTQ